MFSHMYPNTVLLPLYSLCICKSSDNTASISYEGLYEAGLGCHEVEAGLGCHVLEAGLGCPGLTVLQSSTTLY